MIYSVPHMQNRIALAERIEAYLREHLPLASAANLILLNDESWASIYALAGAKAVPSDGTISAVIALVRGREIEREDGLAEAVKSLLERS